MLFIYSIPDSLIILVLAKESIQEALHQLKNKDFKINILSELDVPELEAYYFMDKQISKEIIRELN